MQAPSASLPSVDSCPTSSRSSSSAESARAVAASRIAAGAGTTGIGQGRLPAAAGLRIVVMRLASSWKRASTSAPAAAASFSLGMCS
jgi:hypothetical protein